jgi:chemotaxis protein methyltransferase CheR
MELRESDQAYLENLVRSQSNNLMPAARGRHARQRLSIVVENEGLQTIEDLLLRLRAERPAHLHRAVAEAMTIKETSFFRDQPLFDLLRTKLIPKVLEQCKSQRRLRIWSAACATGQEAYSLAMLLREHFPQLHNWDVRILGTDISQTACDYATRGSYRKVEIDRGLPVRHLLRYFEREGDHWNVHRELRDWVVFERGNLCEPQPEAEKFDLVLLRNVLLYLSPEDRTQVLRHAHARMQPYAPLLLGSAEQAEDSEGSRELFGIEFDRDCYFYRPLQPDRFRTSAKVMRLG